MPKTWNKEFEKEFSLGLNRLNVTQNNLIFAEDFYIIVSEDLSIRELVLAIKTSQWVIVLTGCSHTGIDRIIKRVRKVANLDILVIFGGFHLLRSSTRAICKTVDKLKRMNVKIVAPCHCTGKEAMEIFEKKFAENFLFNGVGRHFSYNK